ncbi:hypothetical protein DXG01_015476 [Tephrocybe rancida]|nr:hypothetical protein DXG01_015476 [Tephrocybe rancida]
MVSLSLSPHCPSPIQKLPVELLSYILAIGAHGVENDDYSSVPSIDAETIKTPLAFSGVSHHWRSVAHKTPSLWTSICITAGLIDPGAGQGQPKAAARFNASHLETYLALSRNYPLNILIDARDQDWDFSEPEIPSDYEYSSYSPPFSSAHMSKAISMLLPHLTRWRSLSILTDSWAPMYVALSMIQPSIISAGAPLLESLTLMRCNDFISYSPTFQPPDMRHPAFLSLNDTSAYPHNPLPRLRNLTLRGVHVDWTSLSTILSQTEYGLDSLDLSSHSMDVRPTLHEFHQILSQSPNLAKLVVNGSGPQIFDEAGDGGLSTILKDVQRASLTCLHDITIGYRSVLEGQAILELLDAPYAGSLTLEDGTHAGDVEDIDAGSLLSFLATGTFPSQESSGPLSTYTGMYSPAEKEDNLNHIPKLPFANASPNSPPTSKAMFPLLHEITLRGVKSCPSNLYALFTSLPNLRHVEFSRMSVQMVRALLPQPIIVNSTVCAAMSFPCPQLQSLCTRGCDQSELQDSFFLIEGIAHRRFDYGCSGLQEVDIHIGNTDVYVAEESCFLPIIGTMVKIIREVPQEEDEDDLMDCDMDSDIDPFEVGGAFNDPAFDAQYTSAILSR